jgi:hypothetical protein
LGKGLAGLMIELDQQHRAMDAVIENAVFFHAAEPCLWFEAVCRPPRQAKNLMFWTLPCCLRESAKVKPRGG